MNDNSSGSTQLGELKYVAIARLADANLLLAMSSTTTKKAYSDEYRKEAQQIATNLGDQTAYPDLREMTESIYGVWYTTCDRNMIAYSVLTDTDYKSTNAYQFLKEVMKEVHNEVPRMQYDLESTPNLHNCKEQVSLLMCGAQDQKKNDKVTKANDIVNQAKKLMGDNVKQMIDNASEFNEMVVKSSGIKETAFNMKNNAKALEREARKRNCRLWAIIICLIISVLVYIIVPIATSFSSK